MIVNHRLLSLVSLLSVWIVIKAAFDPTLSTAKSEVSYSGDSGGERLTAGDTLGARPRHCSPLVMAAQQQTYAPPD